jgi:hypothetical protein
MKNRGFSPEETFGQFSLSISYYYVEVEVEVKLRPTVQFVLVLGTRMGLATNFSFSLKFSLDSCGFVIL